VEAQKKTLKIGDPPVTKYFLEMLLHVVKALGYKPEGRGFEIP
jgi:hypothetical protein